MSNWSAIKDRNNKVKENKTTRNNSCDKDHIQSSTHRDSTTNESGYEELFQSIPCPSCRGLGRIPRGYIIVSRLIGYCTSWERFSKCSEN